MKIGFYAPLKSPSHFKPSGDREIGRLLFKALEALGHKVEVVSNLRSWEGRGCKQRQREIRLASKKQVNLILNKYSADTAPDLIFTYHVYHKAPDWIGVQLARALQIPYLIAEASFAPKQLYGPWHDGHLQTLRCIEQADVIITFNPADIECLKPLVKSEHIIKCLKPFLGEIPLSRENRPLTGNDTADHIKLTEKSNLKRNSVILITVAMMRDGDKKASYKILSEALKKLGHANWQLVIIGDGAAATEIRKFFQAMGEDCIFTGELGNREIFKYLSISDIFVWPAVNEALGLAILEAQACGLPVVTQNYGGVSTIVEDKVTGYVTNPENIDEFVFALNLLIEDKAKRQRMRTAAKNKFKSEHSYEVALMRIKSIIKHVGDR